jgi:hypothetical protein
VTLCGLWNAFELLLSSSWQEVWRRFVGFLLLRRLIFDACDVGWREVKSHARVKKVCGAPLCPFRARIDVKQQTTQQALKARAEATRNGTRWKISMHPLTTAAIQHSH